MNNDWPARRTMADDIRDNPPKRAPREHAHFHEHGGSRHAHQHTHDKDTHAHSAQTDLPAHR